MNYNLTLCHLCNAPMTFKQVRKSVYWLPDMDSYERMVARYDGFVFNFAHRACWEGLRKKRRELIRLTAFKDHEPRVHSKFV